jgi:hypothetical protein
MSMLTSPRKPQRLTVVCWLAAILFAMTGVGVFREGTPLSGIWPLGLLSIFLTVSSLVCGMIFTHRARKMARLLSGEEVLASWILDDAMRRTFAQVQNQESQAKNSAVILLIGAFFLVITILFLFFLKADERLGFFGIMAGLFLVVFIASRFFPWYYHRRNLQGDGQILLGGKYAYINGYLHNWDFPLSGLKRVKVINTPFYGLQLTYYTTDRTFRHDHELKIPAPESVDLDKVAARLRKEN